MSQHHREYLTHKHPAWQGCTLSELATIAFSILVATFVGLMLLGLALGTFSFVGMLTLPITFIGMRIVAPRYAKAKHGKPYGYLLVQLRLWLSVHTGGLLKGVCPYQRRTGRWSTQSCLLKKNRKHMRESK